MSTDPADTRYDFQLAWLNQQLSIDQHLQRIAERTCDSAQSGSALESALAAQQAYYQAREDLLTAALRSLRGDTAAAAAAEDKTE